MVGSRLSRSLRRPRYPNRNFKIEKSLFFYLIKMSCSACGSPLTRDSSGLLKCSICGLLYPRGQNKPLLKDYAKVDIQVKPVKTEEELTIDQIIFINRIAQTLAPTTGLYGDNYKRAAKVQNKYREELREVFQGKRDFNEWFDQKRTERGLHIVTLSRMIYDALEGLESPEAKSLREQYAETIKRIGMQGA